jgi:hypothetical protein
MFVYVYSMCVAVAHIIAMAQVAPIEPTYMLAALSTGSLIGAVACGVGAAALVVAAVAFGSAPNLLCCLL